MKLNTTLAAAAALLAMASAAVAAEPVLAKLQASSGAQKPVAGGAVFECLGDVCAARAPATDTATLRGCKELARQVGNLNSFGGVTKPLSGDQLANCNESAHK
jgi:hypothetical protein